MKGWLSLFVLCALWSFDARSQSVCTEARRLVNKIHALHIQPRKVNDALSSAIFTQFFKRIDPNQYLFTTADTAALSKYKTQLNNDSSEACTFVDEAIKLYRARANGYLHFVDSLLAHPLDYSKVEYIAAMSDDKIASSTSDLQDFVARNIKFEILRSIYRQGSNASDRSLDLQKFLSLEPAARQRVHKNVLIDVQNNLKNDTKLRSFIEYSFLEAIPKAFDPHSSYFGRKEMDRFNEYLSSSALSFGLKFKLSIVDEVVVDQLVPDGPAWRSGKIKSGDAIIGIQWADTNEYIDLIDVELEKVDRILSEGDKKVAALSVKKSNGQVIVVMLAKVLLKNEDNATLDLVLTARHSKRKIGYIALTGFFVDNDGGYEGCAVAVKRELIKLNGEGIDGLIFDLRFNGGGNLQEAMELIGLFVNGPVGIMETVGKKLSDSTVFLANPTSFGDDVVYDGPMIVMINGSSASASELVAGTLQDYNRAVLVGATSYGKGTGQAVFPLGRNEFLKLTESRFYRVSGKPHQKLGIIPDYILPDLNSMMYPRESGEDRALSPKEPSVVISYRKWSKTLPNIKAFSDQNILDPKFALVEKLGAFAKGKIPLKAESFQEFMNNYQKTDHDLYNHSGSLQNDVYSVSNTQFDKMVYAQDFYHAEMNKVHASEIAESIHISEAFKLLDFLISKSK